MLECQDRPRLPFYLDPVFYSQILGDDPGYDVAGRVQLQVWEVEIEQIEKFEYVLELSPT